MTVKDALEVAGIRSTAGVPKLADHLPHRDAEMVARIRRAGAVILGKSNMPTANADFQTSNPIYGRTNNPWDLARTPGGSVGGGAAAVAAGLSSMDLGSEIGGSLRTPAHFTGIFGHKSSFRAMPVTGHLPPGPEMSRCEISEIDMVCGGAMARSANDLELLLRAVAGPTAAESAGLRLEFPPPRAASLPTFGSPPGSRIRSYRSMRRFVPFSEDSLPRLRPIGHALTSSRLCPSGSRSRMRSFRRSSTARLPGILTTRRSPRRAPSTSCARCC